MINTSTMAVRWFYLPALINLSFLVGFLSVDPCILKIMELKNLLLEKQERVLKNVRAEMNQIFQNSLLQGFIVAILYILLVQVFQCSSLSWYHFFNDILCIMIVTTFLLVKITPRRHDMILQGNLSPEETRDWLAFLSCIEYRFWIGVCIALLLGIFLLHLLDLFFPPCSPSLLILSAPNINKKKNKT